MKNKKKLKLIHVNEGTHRPDGTGPDRNAIYSGPMLYRIGYVPCRIEQDEKGIRVWVLN